MHNTYRKILVHVAHNEQQFEEGGCQIENVFGRHVVSSMLVDQTYWAGNIKNVVEILENAFGMPVDQTVIKKIKASELHETKVLSLMGRRSIAITYCGEIARQMVSSKGAMKTNKIYLIEL